MKLAGLLWGISPVAFVFAAVSPARASLADPAIFEAEAKADIASSTDGDDQSGVITVTATRNGKTMVIKHWRQDWTWQPKTLLAYAGTARWSLRAVPEAERKGAWSQTVRQTEDSPRYGGIGRWRYDDGATRWTSDETRRPLARRDATRTPPYDHYLGTNRHVLTPAGWVHEQDNAKIGTKVGKPATFVHEYVINTYAPASDFAIAEADAYWAKTKEYWAAVRGDWDRAIASGSGIKLRRRPITAP